MDIAAHIRIFATEPTDDLVTKRQASIEKLAEQFRARADFPGILSLVNDLASALSPRGALSEELTAQVETTIRDESPAFVRDKQDLQIKVCALLAVLAVLEKATPGSRNLHRVDILAVGLWSAFSFQKPLGEVKLERLRAEVLQRAEELALTAAETARERVGVPTEATEAIAALRLNAAMDREELDLLWWALNDWSNVLKQRLSRLDGVVAGITAGLELGTLLKRFPPFSYKHLVLRALKDSTPRSLEGLLQALGGQVKSLAAVHSETSLPEVCPHVFPLLAALRSGNAKGSGSKETRGADEWAERALLESAILQVESLPLVLS